MPIPAHLKRYIVEQDYGRYTPKDQAVWRYIMHQLKSFLSEHAHPCYVDGLKKTGIEIDRIPRVDVMSRALEKFGWRAVSVSGFIPPAAFMELQSLSYLPIASDMRSIDHLLYTPAPDIVHEAAGHAPILIEPEFAEYLKRYAQVARKALLSKQDLDQYEAIRILSDVKEDPESTPVQIRQAEKDLVQVTSAISYISEAAYLGRMNWWTAEYGLIGSLDKPKIYGAGLLSSVGEARACLDKKVRKIPLTLQCIHTTYDITEMQPQLFVTPDFAHLGTVLEELAATMAFRRGGREGLDKAIQSQCVNTAELNSGLQISGSLKKYWDRKDLGDYEIIYLQMQGPTQLSYKDEELAGHSRQYHAHGFGSPTGFVQGLEKCLSLASDSELARLGLAIGQNATLRFQSGVVVEGKMRGRTRSPQGSLLLIAFDSCTVRYQNEILFQPEWGIFDMAVGSHVTSVFGGPADRKAYGTTDDFVAKVIPRKQHSPVVQYQHQIYQEVRTAREQHALYPNLTTHLEDLLKKVEADFPHEWLLYLEILQLGKKCATTPSWEPRVLLALENLAQKYPELRSRIDDGLALAHQL